MNTESTVTSLSGNIGWRGVSGTKALLSTLLVAFVLVAAPTALSQKVAPTKKPADLKPGEYVWTPETSPSGPVMILVSIDEQRLYTYRNGVLIGYSTVSTGREGHETPTGVFTVLQKDKDHKSNIYNSAPMPYMERLTWTGIALHAGKLPGYPASHGCVRLPLEFSKLLFELNSLGTTVVIADAHAGPREAVHPGAVLSPDATQADGGESGISTTHYEWKPDRAPEGPVSMVLSGADRTLYVYRNGVEIGHSRVELQGDAVLPEGVFTVLEGYEQTASPFVEGKRDHRWLGVPHGNTVEAAPGRTTKLAEKVRIPRDFAARVYDILAPGSTILITNLEAAPHDVSGEDFVVMATAHPDQKS